MSNKINKNHILLLFLVITMITILFFGCTTNSSSISSTVVITFDTNDGETIAPRTIEKDTPKLELPTPTKTGYDFLGWYSDTELTNKINNTDIPQENVTYYAKWERKNFTVTFASENTFSYVNVAYGDDLPISSMPDVPEKEGYSGRWDTENLTNIIEDITIQATYTLLDGHIYFLVDENDVDENYEYISVPDVEFPNYNIYFHNTGIPNSDIEPLILKPYKENYYFAGWYYDKYHTEVCTTLPTTIPLGSTILYAHFLDVSNMAHYFTYSQDENEVSITGLTSDGKLQNYLVVPEEINGKPVTSIGQLETGTLSSDELCVFDNKYLTSVIIPDTITSIGSFAFAKCPLLSNIRIDGNSLATIGTGAFAGCSNITDFILPDSVMTINDYAFAGITNIENDNPITFDTTSDNWKTKEQWYSVDMNLDNFAINETSSLNNLKTRIFYNTPNLKYLQIPNTINTINNQIFDGTSLEEIFVYEGNSELQNIGSAIYSSDGKTLLYYPSYGNSEYTLADSTEHISAYAFYSTETISSITANSKLKSIGSYAFANSSNLDMVDLSNSSVETVGEYAFSNLEYLTEINFPASFKLMGRHIFDNCTGLMNVTFAGNLITEIESYTFNNCISLKNITIPQYVMAINSHAFYNCNSLENVYFYDDAILEYINDYSFTNCFNLNPINLPSTLISIGAYAFASTDENNPNTAGITLFNTPNLTTIGDYAFQNNTGITNAQLPSSLTSLGEGIFYNCTRLIQLFLNNLTQIEKIPDYSFYNCTAVKDTLIFPDTITEIGNYAFYNCNSFTSISFDSIKTIGDYAFSNCTSLNEGPESKILPLSLTSIGKSAFNNCQDIQTIYIPNNLTYISENAFSNCTSLSLVKFNENSTIDTIYNEAFSNCTSLETFDIPLTLKTRSETTGFIKNPFVGCTNLVQFTSNIENINDIKVDDNGILYTEDEGISIYAYPTGRGESIQLATNVVKIEDYAFYGSSIDQLSFKTGIVTDNKLSIYFMEIGNYAFSHCDDLESVNISSRVVNIESNAFAYSSSLSSITFDNTEISNGAVVVDNPSATYEILNPTLATTNELVLGNYCFDHSGITSVNIPSRISLIGDYAFSNCFNLVSLDFATSDFIDSLTIGNYAFYRDHGLTQLLLPSTISNIGNYAFAWCVNVTNVKFSYEYNNTLDIGDYAFNNCNYLYQIEFPQSLNSLGKGVFSQNTRLKNVIFPNIITSSDIEIPEEAFFDATSLESITIPSYVNKIGKYAFANLNFDTLIIENDDDALIVDDYAFSGLSNLYQIDTNRSLALGKYALYNTPITELNTTITKLDDYSLSKTNITTLSISSNCFIDNSIVIGKGVFADTSYLESININNDENVNIPDYCFSNSSINTINFTSTPQNLILGDYCFVNTANLTNILIENESGIELKANIKLSIGNGSFNYNNVKNITLISGNILSIKDYSFSYMPNLLSIDANANTISEIGSFAFSHSPKLNSLDIIASTEITSISDGFISYTTELTDISLNDGSNHYVVYDGVVYDDNSNTLFAYPSGKIGATYQANQGTLHLNDYAFSGNNKLSNLILADDYVVTKDENTFKDADSIKLFVPSYYVNDYINQWGTNNVTHINVEFDNMLLRLLSNNNYSIEKYTGTNTSLVIEHTLTVNDITYNIVSIDDNAFKNNARLQTVTIKQGIIEIGKYSFANCVNLESISMEKVLFLNSHAFYNCPNLVNVNLSYGITEINDFAFANCNSLSTITLPDSLITIENSAFYNCSGLQEIILPNNLTTIESNSFDSCSSLIKITIPENVSVIENYAFANCAELTFIYLHTNIVPNIQSSTFINTNSEKVFLIPEKIKVDFASKRYWNIFAKQMYVNEHIYLDKYVLNKIPDSTDYELDCILLTSYTTVPHIIDNKTITTIGKKAINRFAIDIVIEEGYTTLDKYAFASAKLLQSVSLPSSLITIDDYAFYNCEKLDSFTMRNTPNISKLETIGNYALYNTNLTHITIPSNVNYIGKYALSADEFANLQTITFDFNIESTIKLVIDDYALANNKILREITFNGTVSYIGVGAFNNCISLTKLDFKSTKMAPETKDENSIFENCTSLSVFVPNDFLRTQFRQTWKNSNDKARLVLSDNIVKDEENSVKYITQNGVRVVVDTYNYFVYSIIDGTTDQVEIINYIGDYTGDYIDYNNTGVGAQRDSDIVIPDSFRVGSTTYQVVKIGNYAFNNIITSVVIPNSINEIKSNAFYGATSLETVTISSDSSLQTIGAYAFYNCINLDNIFIPKTVENIGQSAFGNCSSLTNVTFENFINNFDNSTLSFHSSVFVNCTALTTITLPKHWDNLGDYMFSNCTSLQTVNFEYAENGGNQLIGEYCFENTNIKSITFPVTISYVGDYAFNNCDNLKSVYLTRIMDSNQHNSLTSTEANVFNNIENSFVRVYVPNSVFNNYITNEGWKTKSVLANLVDDDNSFNYRLSSNSAVITNILSENKVVTIPEYISVTENGTTKQYNIASIDAFAGNTTVEEIQFSTSTHIVEIASQAFAYCINLKKIHLPNTITSIGSETFTHCHSLTDIVLPTSINTIATRTFAYCYSLKEITLPSSIVEINEASFIYCTSLNRLIVESETINSLGSGSLDKTNSHLVIIVPTAKKANYVNEWSKYSTIIYGRDEMYGDYVYNETLEGIVIKQYNGYKLLLDEETLSKIKIKDKAIIQFDESACVNENTIVILGD